MAIDPYWSDVVLRQTFDVDFTDVSNVGQPYIQNLPIYPASIGPGKFSNALRCETNGRGIRAAAYNPAYAFGSGDFTVEFWLQRIVGSPGYYDHYMSVWESTAGRRGWWITSTSPTESPTTIALDISADGNTPAISVNIPGLINRGTWYHFCLERSAGVFRVYIDGVMKWKLASAISIFDSPMPLRMGGGTGTTSFTQGGVLIDDTRITKGVARYASDAGFAVPTEAYPTSGGTTPISVSPTSGSMVLTGIAPSAVIGVAISPLVGDLRFEGATPSLSEFYGVSPGRGEMAVSGVAPEILSAIFLDPGAGSLRLLGRAPGVFVGVTVTPAIGALRIDGQAPILFTVSGAIASQVASLSLAQPEPPQTRSSQLAALALAEPPPPPVRASQAAVLTIGEIVPDVLASQLATLVLGHGSACVTERCQIWKITRRDGRVFRYTSHDRPVFYGGQTYSACRSLNPSASENASTLGSVGNMELLGIIDDEGISEADLYGGLFDDAFVTVDLITWGRGTEVPRRLAAGWTGSLSQGETGFKMEVLGPGARLEQQALVQMVTPGCRWVFGSKECGVDVEALKLAGAVVSAKTRGAFVATLPASPAERQWENGRVRWTSGVNEGQITETKTVDFETGQVVLWASTGFLPEPGDTFDLIPGCDFNRDGGCTVYANVINFGGFPDLPGADAILETPVAQY